MNRLSMIFNQRVDQSIINEQLDADLPFFIDVIATYDADLPTIPINLLDLDGTSVEEWFKVIDKATFTYEEGAFIAKITRSGKTFSLANSYLRDQITTDVLTPLTPLPDGTGFILRFFTPGFAGAKITDVSLWYGLGFGTLDLDALDALGITLTGDGTSFTIANTVECKIAILKPTIATEIYSIEYRYDDDLIEV